MSIAFGDVNLLIPTSTINQWQERYWPMNELLLWTLPNDDWLHERAPGSVHAGWPGGWPPDPVSLNTLYWPSGAARFGFFVGLVNSEIKDQCLEAAAADANAKLILHDEDHGNKVEPVMSLLTPRPFTSIDNCLWLLPFVDARYWWQFKSTGDLDVTDSTTWANLYTALETALGTSIAADSIDADYLQPSPCCAALKERPLGLVLDAAAHSVGQRIVFGFDGTVKAQGWAAAKTQADINLAGQVGGEDWSKLSGDTIQTAERFGLRGIPEKVRVAFRKGSNGVLDPNGDKKTYDNEPLAQIATGEFADGSIVADTMKVINSCAISDHTTNGLSGTPDNDADLDALATKIAADYYAGLERKYDVTYFGMKLWTPTAYDNLISIHHAALRLGGLETRMRIQTEPDNYGVEDMLHGDPAFPCDDYDHPTADGNPPLSSNIPCYAVRNNGSQSHTKNTTGNVTLDTQIHRYPNDGTNFTLAANEVTVVLRKVVSLKWSIHFTAISANIAGSVWLEDNGTLIKGTLVTYSIGPGSLGHIEGSIDHVMSAANAEIRMRISEILNSENVTIYGDDSNGYSRLDIAVIRDP